MYVNICSMYKYSYCCWPNHISAAILLTEARGLSLLAADGHKTFLMSWMTADRIYSDGT